MNTIIEERSKLDELCQDGYKIIYPNAIDGLGFELEVCEKRHYYQEMMQYASKDVYPIVMGSKCEDLTLYERHFKFKNTLFLMPYKFETTSTREYTLYFDNGKAKKSFNVKRITITSDNTNERPNNEFTEKINYVLFNPETNRLVFYIDDNFQTAQSRKAKAEKSALSQKESKLEEDLDSLFNN